MSEERTPYTATLREALGRAQALQQEIDEIGCGPAEPLTLAELKDQVNRTIKAKTRMQNASNSRRAVPPGSSRARITTANANWSNACDAYDAERDKLTSMARQIVAGRLEYHR